MVLAPMVLALTVAAIALAQPVAVTQLRVYTPSVAGRISAGVEVSERVTGACVGRSLASPDRPDAYRCTSEDAVLDPCYLDPAGPEGRLLCASEPFSLEVVELSTDEPPAQPDEPPVAPDYRAARPWALVLEGGQRCTVLTGATADIAGMRVDYGCDDGSAVVGPIDRTLSVWRVFHRAHHGAPSLDRLVIVEAWF